MTQYCDQTDPTSFLDLKMRSWTESETTESGGVKGRRVLQGLRFAVTPQGKPVPPREVLAVIQGIGKCLEEVCSAGWKSGTEMLDEAGNISGSHDIGTVGQGFLRKQCLQWPIWIFVGCESTEH